jgi:CBS domain-containing protein
MTVTVILDGKGRDVVSVPPDTLVATLCDILAERRIGAVVVTTMQGAILGMMSERDVVRAVSRQGTGALDRPVLDFMTRAVATCAPEDTIDSVMQRMTAGRFRHMPVLEDGQLAGLVSIGDVVKHRIAEVEREAEEIRSYIATA